MKLPSYHAAGVSDADQFTPGQRKTPAGELLVRRQFIGKWRKASGQLEILPPTIVGVQRNCRVQKPKARQVSSSRTQRASRVDRWGKHSTHLYAAGDGNLTTWVAI